jgi:hypothetical protein
MNTIKGFADTLKDVVMNGPLCARLQKGASELVSLRSIKKEWTVIGHERSAGGRRQCGQRKQKATRRVFVHVSRRDRPSCRSLNIPSIGEGPLSHRTGPQAKAKGAIVTSFRGKNHALTAHPDGTSLFVINIQSLDCPSLHSAGNIAFPLTHLLYYSGI